MQLTDSSVMNCRNMDEFSTQSQAPSSLSYVEYNSINRLLAFATCDQIFIHSVDRWITSVYLCQGRTVKVIDVPTSTLVEQHLLVVSGENGKEVKSVKKWFSKKCLGILLLSRELIALQDEHVHMI